MMKKWKHWLLPTVLLLSLVLAACSNEEPEEEAESTDTAQTDNETTDDNMEQEPDEPATGEDEEETNNDEHIEHQLGLSIGDTATVVSSPDDLTYEVTINEVSYRDELENVTLYDDTFVLVDVTVENVDDKTFDAADIFTPAIGELDSEEYVPAVDSEYLQNTSEITMVEGELAPGDSVEGTFVFDAMQVEQYNLAFGHAGDQITTRAEWEFNSDEIQ
ncbi:DUF4352 domain-containing protein [Gracilibacillus phocaeensis]|uniref:DUF4352 domain-containing protein n=1 Tax=Gracilibacillus phocaeensis TaxID=2042304 RepID=UPI00102FC40E|nr:DUF4352 domain-containing protein [Gracilibacillus phocaeensis]